MTPAEREIEQTWIDEAERRVASWQAGEAKMALGRLREKYGRTRVRAGR